MTFENLCQEAAKAKATALGRIFYSRQPGPLSRSLSPLVPPFHKLEESESEREGEKESPGPAEEEARTALEDAADAYHKAEREADRTRKEKAASAEDLKKAALEEAEQVYTYIHTHIHTYTHTHIHTHRYSRPLSWTHTSEPSR
jgi:hypothetical protein